MFTITNMKKDAEIHPTLLRVIEAGNALKKIRTQADLARVLNIQDQNVTNWSSRGVPSKVATQLQDMWSCSASWIMTGNGDMLLPSVNVLFARQEQKEYAIDNTVPVSRFSKLPIVGTAQLGDDGYWAELDYPTGHGDGYIQYPSKDPSAYALRCKGDSMKPRIKQGEYVVIEPNHAPVNGDEVLVKCKRGRVMVKELLYIRDNIVHLGSVNEVHGKISIDQSDIETIHFVAAIVKNALWMPE
jgi:phage repressor protein C with HTH and peptisase S24 domain